MTNETIVEPLRIIRRKGGVNAHLGGAISSITLTNSDNDVDLAEITLDYGQCEGGIPVFEVSRASGNECLEVAVVYSEGIEGIDHATGDGPFFLFSNAMDTYRNITMAVQPSRDTQIIRAQYAQRSQRYQKIRLTSPNASITFSKAGFEVIRPKATARSSFTCSNELLNEVWQDGVKTVDMCTVHAQETAPAWDVTESGTRVTGQHWAPCRHGTRWADKTVRFQVLVESGGASWGIHMVANGLIFCLDVEQRILYASEGLSHQSTIFPVAEKGRWELKNLPLSGWLEIETIARNDTVSVAIQGQHIATITGLDIRPLLGGAKNNTGSVAFGGPCGWTSTYRHLQVHDGMDKILHANSLLPIDRDRTLADFQVGTSALACTIDGAKRDRACFGGDLYVMGRSIAHSTMNFEAIKGSIDLLTSHQSKVGYLGNLCPIQAPVHEGDQEPPTYAFYSLTYALLLVVAIKDYWLHTGDEAILAKLHNSLVKLFGFLDGLVNDDGLVVAPPPLSMHWYPMGGPIFGVSTPLNISYFEALQAMSLMYEQSPLGAQFSTKAEVLMTRILPPHQATRDRLCDQAAKLPRAFRDLAHWSVNEVVSPYATGFAVEALLSNNDGPAAVDLVERVWGTMADKASSNYSGGHWEAMRPDGSPHGHDTSLIHGWSTWPVFLMPRYIAGLYPIEAGWKTFGVSPVLAGLDWVDCTMETVAGTVKLELRVDEKAGHGTISLLAPKGTTAKVEAPKGWLLHGSELVQGSGDWEEFMVSKEGVDPKTYAIATSKARTESESLVSENVARPEETIGKPPKTAFRHLLSLWRSCFR